MEKNNERRNTLAIAVEYLGWAGFTVLLEKSSCEVLGGVCRGSQAANAHRPHLLESVEVVSKFWLGGCSSKNGGRKYLHIWIWLLTKSPRMKILANSMKISSRVNFLKQAHVLNTNSMGVSPRLSGTAWHWLKGLGYGSKSLGARPWKEYTFLFPPQHWFSTAEGIHFPASAAKEGFIQRLGKILQVVSNGNNYTQILWLINSIVGLKNSLLSSSRLD